MHTQREDIARSRGSRAPVGDWHQCRRYWKFNLECAFHGKEPEEDKDEDRDLDPEEPDVVEVGVAETPGVADIADNEVPVVARRKTDLARQAEAEVGFAQADSAFQEEAFGDAIGIPTFPDKLAPGKITEPLYIADERMFEQLGIAAPEGIQAQAEEALVEAVAKSGSLAVHQEEAFPQVGSPIGQSLIGWEQLAYIFIGIFTANTLQHMRNVVAPRVTGPPSMTTKPGPPQLFKPGDIKNPPIRMTPRVPVGGSRGGGGGYNFPSSPGNPKFPIKPKAQEEWDVILDAAIPSPTVEGGQDVD